MATFLDQELSISTPLTLDLLDSNIDYQLTTYYYKVGKYSRSNTTFHCIILPEYLRVIIIELDLFKG